MKKLLLHESTGFLVDADSGVVYGIRRNAISGSPRPPKGYAITRARVDGVFKNIFLHRVVWEAANGRIDHTKDARFINHINGIKSDNRLSNLELVTASQNTRHAYASGLFGNKKGRCVTSSNRPRPVLGTCALTGEKKEYPSIRAVAIDGFSPAAVLHCCNGAAKTCKGFSWEFMSGFLSDPRL